MNEEEKRVSWGPSPWWIIIYGVLGLSITALASLLLFVSATTWPSDISVSMAMTSSALLPALILFVIGLLLLWKVYDMQLNRRPYLILTRAGIEWCPARSKGQFYAWKDVGVFKLIHGGKGLWPHYSARAYNSKNHRVLNEDLNTTTASRFNSDISFAIYQLDCGYFKADQQKVVDELNKWRDKFHSDEEGEQPITPFEVRTMKAKHETKVSAFNHMAWGLGILLVLLFIISLMSH